MLPAGYPPQLLFSARPDAVVHFPHPRAHSLSPVSPLFPSARRTAFLRFLHFPRPHAAQPSSGFSTFPVARRTAFLRFLHLPRPRAHSLSPVSPLFPSARAQPFSGFSAFPVRLALAVSRFPVCLSYVHKKSSPQGAENQKLTQNSAHQAYFAKSF